MSLRATAPKMPPPAAIGVRFDAFRTGALGMMVAWAASRAEVPEGSGGRSLHGLPAIVDGGRRFVLGSFRSLDR